VVVLVVADSISRKEARGDLDEGTRLYFSIPVSQDCSLFTVASSLEQVRTL